MDINQIKIIKQIKIILLDKSFVEKNQKWRNLINQIQIIE